VKLRVSSAYLRVTVLALLVVRLVVENGKGPVKLLQQDDAGQFVGEGEVGEGQLGMGRLRHLRGEAQRTTNEEGDTAVSFQLLRDKFGQIFAGGVLAGRRQGNQPVTISRPP
jgi:hypothetical protein